MKNDDIDGGGWTIEGNKLETNSSIRNDEPTIEDPSAKVLQPGKASRYKGSMQNDWSESLRRRVAALIGGTFTYPSNPSHQHGNCNILFSLSIRLSRYLI